MDTRWVRRSLFVACSAGLFACAAGGGHTSVDVQKVYTPSFKFEDTAPVKDEMHAMARAVHRLEQLLGEDNEVDEVAGAEVLQILTEMSVITAKLVQEPSMSNHWILEQRIAELDANVQAARDTARAKRPNYFMAGSVVGSCTLCHE